jgi:hypothetical protein
MDNYIWITSTFAALARQSERLRSELHGDSYAQSTLDLYDSTLAQELQSLSSKPESDTLENLFTLTKIIELFKAYRESDKTENLADAVAQLEEISTELEPVLF